MTTNLTPDLPTRLEEAVASHIEIAPLLFEAARMIRILGHAVAHYELESQPPDIDKVWPDL